MVIPYITFAGDCNKALEFYRIVFNTEIQMSQPYGDYVPQGVLNPPSNLRDWIYTLKCKSVELLFGLLTK